MEFQLKQTNNSEAFDILERIIARGGLLGQCAKLYTDNISLTETFIVECNEQSHTTLIKEYLGEDLVKDISAYSTLRKN